MLVLRSRDEARRYPLGDDAVAGAEQRTQMQTLRRWLVRVVAPPEPFPGEFRAEQLDQCYPLARPAGWHEAQEVGRVRPWLR